MTDPHRTKPRDREPRPKSTREERIEANRHDRRTDKQHCRDLRRIDWAASDNENEGH